MISNDTNGLLWGSGSVAGVTSIIGTANQITVSTLTGNVTLNLPQDISTNSQVRFARVLDSSINTNNMLLGTGSGFALTTGTTNTLLGSLSGKKQTK